MELLHMGYELTKSRYCKGLQCPKILWMDQHHPELGEDVASQSVLDNGTKVGELARSYFGEYELVPLNVNKAEMADKTRELMKSVDNIAEASFFDYSAGIAPVRNFVPHRASAL